MTPDKERRRLAMMRKLSELAFTIGFCGLLLGVIVLALLWPILKVAAVIKYLLS